MVNGTRPTSENERLAITGLVRCAFSVSDDDDISAMMSSAYRNMFAAAFPVVKNGGDAIDVGEILEREGFDVRPLYRDTEPTEQEFRDALFDLRLGRFADGPPPCFPDPGSTTAREFLNLKLPKRDYLFERILPASGQCLLHGGTGLGKTWFCLSLATAAAGNARFLDWQPTRHSKVCYIDGESSSQDFQSRVVACLEMLPAASAEAALDNLTMVCANQFEIGLPSLATHEGYDWYSKTCEGSDLVIVDNLSTLAWSEKDENSPDSWQPVQNWALSQRRQNRTVIFVHHSGKGGEQRGTSARTTIMDRVFRLQKPKRYNPTMGAHFELHIEKQRDYLGNLAAPKEVQLTSLSDLGMDWTFGPISREGPDNRERDEHIRELKQQGLSIREISSKVHLGKSRVNEILKAKK